MSAEYFKIDTNSRAPFQYGICLYLCWGTMIIYGVGASLYTFSGKSTDSGLNGRSMDGPWTVKYLTHFRVKF